MKFIMVNGASCAGKSTIVDQILTHKERYFRLSYDALKWLFSQYRPTTHYNDVSTLVGAVLERVSTMEYNIVCDGGLHREWRESLFSIVRPRGYEVVEINIEAAYDVLLKRFDERVADALVNKSKRISNTSVERFKELFDTYEAEKNPSAITFRTDSESIDEIVRKVLAYS